MFINNRKYGARSAHCGWVCGGCYVVAS